MFNVPGRRARRRPMAIVIATTRTEPRLRLLRRWRDKDLVTEFQHRLRDPVRQAVSRGREPTSGSSTRSRCRTPRRRQPRAEASMGDTMVMVNSQAPRGTRLTDTAAVRTVLTNQFALYLDEYPHPGQPVGHRSPFPSRRSPGKVVVTMRR